MKKRFNSVDAVIIRTLYQEGIPMTIGELSQKTKISWITVKNHIKKLVEYNLVEQVTYPDRNVTKVVWNFTDFGNMATLQA